MIYNDNILYIANIPFNDALKQRPQYIIDQLIQYNNVVVLQAPMSFPKRLWKKPIIIEKQSNLKMIQFNFLPPFREILKGISFSYFNRILLLLILRIVLDTSKTYTVITNSVNMLNYKKLRQVISIKKLIYDCVDEHAGFPQFDQTFIELEMQLIEAADKLTTSSRYLQRKYYKFGKTVNFIPNGVNFSYYSQIRQNFNDSAIKYDVRNNYSVVLGYVGAIESWFDFEILKKVLDAFSSIRIVLIGVTKDREVVQFRDKLIKDYSDRLVYLGYINHFDTPKYIKYFDYGIIPFNLAHPVIRGVNPLKLFEYFAMNKPVIATIWDEISQYEDDQILISFSNFINNNNLYFSNNNLGDALQIAEEHSWANIIKMLD